MTLLCLLAAAVLTWPAEKLIPCVSLCSFVGAVWVNLNKELWESKEVVTRMQASIDTLELENQELRETVSQLRALVSERALDQQSPLPEPGRETERQG